MLFHYRHSLYRFLFLLLLSALPAALQALTPDSLLASIRQNCQEQEKVYVHLDNNCYFVGDTIWYKAYVLRADSLCPTNMSRLLYVELLSPDGLVVDRQRVVVSERGYTCGQFALEDSLYSGYYEIRAYTKWMLNFNVGERSFTRDDSHRFYSRQMARDFYRDWQGLYSRVVPVYSKPERQGDYDGKYMYDRPKMEMPFTPKKTLNCKFYPEGGRLVAGLRSRVAFELTDQDGQAVSIAGKLDNGTAIRAGYLGRGLFTVCPMTASDRAVAHFTWNGDTYDFRLPKADEAGAVVTLDGVEGGGALAMNVQVSHCAAMAYAVLCRGQLRAFHTLPAAGGKVPLDLNALPTGVNELQVFAQDGSVLADRLFFVNHHDAADPISVSADKRDYNPYEPIHVTVKRMAGPDANALPLSVSVRDTRTDDSSFDDGDIMADMLLCSDLKGFVASPAYYFEKDDATHRQALDLLMMVQGWRKYAAFAKSDGALGWGHAVATRLRYQPEQSLVVEGSVNKQLGVPFLQITDVRSLDSLTSVSSEDISSSINVTNGGVGVINDMNASTQEQTNSESETGISESQTDEAPADDYSLQGEMASLGVNHGSLKHEVLLEAELDKGAQSAGLVQRTHDGGRFQFVLPPFYGQAVLFLTAYDAKDSLKRSLTSRKDKHKYSDDHYPDYYVKRDLFYPVFTQPYSFYQTHLPDLRVQVDSLDGGASWGALKGDHVLGTVRVEARRRSRRGVDYSKPAYVVDAYQLYNEATDRGLSWGVANMGTFPPVACVTVYGNMNRRQDYNIRATLDDYTFYENFKPLVSKLKNRADAAVFNDLQLKRIRNFRFYTDFEPRNCDAPHTERVNEEDIIVRYELLADDAVRHTYRDRRIVINGVAIPEQQYSPDYSHYHPKAPTDYRRTLYWNPNAQLDANGELHITLYNNSRPTRVGVDVQGVAGGGKFYVTSPAAARP